MKILIKRRQLITFIIILGVVSIMGYLMIGNQMLINGDVGASNGISALTALKEMAGESSVEALADIKNMPDEIALEDYLTEYSTYMLDEESIDRTVQTYLTGAESTAAASGISIESLLVDEWGYDSVDDYRSYVKEYLDVFIKERLAVYELAKNKNITINKKEYKKLLPQYAEEYGYDDVTAFVFECKPASIANEMLYDKVVSELHRL